MPVRACPQAVGERPGKTPWRRRAAATYIARSREAFMASPQKIYRYLPQATVVTTMAKAYLSLLAGAASS